MGVSIGQRPQKPQRSRVHGVRIGHGSPELPSQRVTQGDGLIFHHCQHAGPGDVWIENDVSIALTHHDVGETRRTPVQRTGNVVDRLVVAGLLSR
jgi:hypothetical protein